MELTVQHMEDIPCLRMTCEDIASHIHVVTASDTYSMSRGEVGCVCA
jgi:hypothetical protein